MRYIAAIAATALLACSRSRADLVHFYPFDGDAADFAGQANGSLVNGAAVIDGALVLDGVNDFVQFEEMIVPTTGSYSVAMFFRAAVVQLTYVELISQGFSGGPGFYLGHTPSGTIRVTDTWGNQAALAVLFPQNQTWHHIAVTVGGGASRLYIDGTPRALLCAEITTTTMGTDTRLGRQFDFPGNEWFAGLMDDVRIYDETLSPAGVAALAEAVHCAGDLNGDKVVDGADLGIQLGSWGGCRACDLCAGDVNVDGVVDGADLGVLLGAWGDCGS